MISVCLLIGDVFNECFVRVVGMSRIKPATSTHAADWLQNRMVGFADNVDSIVPTGFERYVRILHPAYVSAGDELTPISWKRVADSAGQPLNKASHWHQLIAQVPEDQQGLYVEPSEGTLDNALFEELINILKSHSDKPDNAWFGVWEGYDYKLPFVDEAPKISVGDRHFNLLNGSLDDASESFCKGPFFQSANMVWPDDNQWFLASEIDLKSTYLAGSSEVLQDVLKGFSGDVFEVDATDDIT